MNHIHVVQVCPSMPGLPAWNFHYESRDKADATHEIILGLAVLPMANDAITPNRLTITDDAGLTVSLRQDLIGSIIVWNKEEYEASLRWVAAFDEHIRVVREQCVEVARRNALHTMNLSPTVGFAPANGG